MLPKILFLHIHKTAGSTFCSDLAAIYGDNCYRFTEGDQRNRDKYVVNDYLNKHLCIHGHIERYYLKNIYDYALITFLREPVSRTISHYYYLKDYTTMLLGTPTLLEFAEQTSNYQTKFLGDMDEYSFVGITDEYVKSMNKFRSWLGLPAARRSSTYLNRNTTKPPVSAADKQYIASINEEDIILYNKYKDILLRGD